MIKKNFILLSATTTTTLIVLFSLLFLSFPLYKDYVSKSRYETNFELIVQDLERLPLDELLIKMEEHDKNNPSVFFNIVNTDGKLLYPKVTKEMSKSMAKHYIDGGLQEIGIWSKAIKSTDNQELLFVGEYSFSSLTDTKQVIYTLFPTLILAALVVSAIVSLCYSIISARRIKKLTQRVHMMRDLKDINLAPEMGNDELANLAQDINHLYQEFSSTINRLEEVNTRVSNREKEKSEFLRITAHELKTPITSMLGMIDGMIHRIGAFKNREKYLEECKKMLFEHSKMVNSVLQVSRYNLDAPLDGKITTVDVSEAIRLQLRTYRNLRELKDIRCTASFQTVYLKVNEEYFIKALRNILDNAFNYTPEHGKIDIVLTDKQLSITNDSDHVLDKNQIDKMKIPFFQVPKKERVNPNSTGLGFYIIDRILTKHNLGYQMQSYDGKSMTFEIFFPQTEGKSPKE